LLHNVHVPRERHQKKEVERALREAEVAGWTVEVVHHGHTWGRVRCGDGCDPVTVFSTPRQAEVAAKIIRQAVRRCPHH
jgi:hypothetical protein